MKFPKFSPEREEKKRRFVEESEDAITRVCFLLGENWGTQSPKASENEIEEKWRYNLDREKSGAAWMVNLWYGSHQFSTAIWGDFEDTFFQKKDVKKYYIMFIIGISGYFDELKYLVSFYDTFGNLLDEADKRVNFVDLDEVEKYVASLSEMILKNRGK
ncbi:MAG: hypothetical protein SGI73_07575 [Chloroflexota bacterium]|nr:hypothetical protein [Chloroflexota bacterium]